MKLREYLSDCQNEELTRRLAMLDKSIMELHQYGFFVVDNLANIEVYDDCITLESFKNKIDYLNSGYNENGDRRDILELCAIEICAYNEFQDLYSDQKFIIYLTENINKFLTKVPSSLHDYYKGVLVEGNIDYLNKFLEKLNSNSGKGNERQRTYVKTTKDGIDYSNVVDYHPTAVGKALNSRNNAAYSAVLLLPAFILISYILGLIIYYIVIRK